MKEVPFFVAFLLCGGGYEKELFCDFGSIVCFIPY